MSETTAVTAQAWQGETINGTFRIGRYLGGSAHSSVFLAETNEHLPKAAIKIIPVHAEDAERLAQIRQAAALSHRHLLAILDCGYVRLGDTTALYIITEYAEEDLSLVLPERALTENEARETLRPLLEVLAYLHGAGFVHGSLKPSNIMAVGDCLKLSSDSICRTGTHRYPETPDVHDAPEVREGALTPAADTWSLGVTLVEVLAQRPPEWNGRDLLLPDGMPFPFPQIARRCLSLDPAQRWNVADISACLPIGAASQPAAATSSPGKDVDLRKWRYPALGIGALLVLGGLLIIPRNSGSSDQERTPEDPQTAGRAPSTEPKPSAEQLAQSSSAAISETSQATDVPGTEPASQPAAAPEVREALKTEPSAPMNRSGAGSVVRQVLPDVPRKAMDTITGSFRNSIRATVNDAGDVTDAKIESQGPSRYFANQSLQAAREWKFSAGSPGEWTLTFQYRSDNIAAKASPVR